MPAIGTWSRKLLAFTVALSLALPGIAGGAPEGNGAAASPRASSQDPDASPPRFGAAESPSGTVRLAVRSSKPGVEGLKTAGREMGFKVGRTIPRIGWTAIDVPAQAADAVASSLVKQGLASKVERDIRTHLASIPNDASFSSMWDMHNTGQTGGTPDADIDAPEAWEVETGSSSVIVAVCDTGVQLSHPDLAGNAWVNPADPPNGIDDDGNEMIDDVNGWDWVHNDKTVYDSGDGDEHGTHVAGTIGAVGNNGVGVTGVNQDVSIMSLKTIGPMSGSLLDAAAAITYAVDHGATVINHSWTSEGTIEAMDDAIAYASSHGVINVAAAGNEGSRNDEYEYFPAAYDDPNVIAVAATDDMDVLPWWSNWGTEVDLAAPGETIYSTVPANSYDSLSGTSMAAPHVTGAIALLRAAFPAASADEIRSRLLETVDRSTVEHGPTGRVASNGRLNLASALAPQIAAAPTITSPTPGEALPFDHMVDLTWTPSPYTSGMSSYEIDLGFDYPMWDASFEYGNLVPPWIPGGNVPFYRATGSSYSHTGAYGVRSGDIADGEVSTLSTTIEIPPEGGTLSFWYWLDSEDGYDIAYLTVDGVDYWGMNRDRPWTRAEVQLPSGLHTVQWAYVKDESVSEGLDAFGVDDISVTFWQSLETMTAAPGSTSASFYVYPVWTESGGIRVRAVLGDQVSNWSTIGQLKFGPDPQPSPPTGLVATPLDRAVTLVWDDAPETDVTKWAVYRKIGGGPDSFVAFTSVPTFTDTGLTNGIVHHYDVVAFNSDDHLSEPVGVDVTPLDIWPPAAPTGLVATAGAARIRLEWDDALESDVAGWEVWRSVDGGEGAKIADAANRWYDDLALPPGTTYSYDVYAVDDDDNRSAAANVGDIPLDLEPPAAPTGLAATPLDGAVSLSWDDGAEPDLASWQVWRAEGAGEFALVDETTDRAYTDTGLTNGVTYRYRLVAFDNVANESPACNPVTVVPQDVWAPGTPTGLIAVPGHEQAMLDWDNAIEPDLDHWEVWRAEDGQPPVKVDDVASSAFSESDLKSRVPYTYSVIAVDDDGNAGDPALVTVTPLDKQEPAAPSGLSAVASAGRVDLTWDAALETDVASWDVLRSTSGGAYTKIGSSTERKFADTQVGNTVTYSYRVKALDLSDNPSVPSSVVSATPRATEKRLQGANRYATAIAVSASSFAPGVDTVVLATGESFPDALSASALAGCYGGPLLLTPASRLPDGLAAELVRLKAKKIVVVGGTSAVSSAVFNALDASYDVMRIHGRDRYETAAKVATEVKRLGGGERVFVARGDTFPDALSASPAAYAKRYPVLLVRSDAVPDVTRGAIASLRPTEAVVLGSTSAVSAKVASSLGVIAMRWGGSTRYATSAIIASESAARGWTSFGAAGVATGESFPDALGGGAAIGARGGVLLLTPGTTLSPNASVAIRGNVRDLDRAFIIGGPSAVSIGVEKAVRGLLGL